MPKPPYELADKSGQQQFARTMGAIGTNLLDKYLQARQANEESQFIGQVKSAQAGFRNWLQKNPQATPEEMFAERDKMVKSIDDISVNNKFLPATKNDIKNFIASNKEKIIKDADYDIIAIGMQQQMTQLNANIDLLEMEGDYPGVEKLVDDSPLSQADKDLAKAKAKVKIDTLNHTRDIEAVRTNYQAVIDNGGTKEQAYQVIDEGVQLFGLSAKEKETLGNNLDNYVEGRIAKQFKDNYTKKVASYDDMVVKLATADLTPDDIEMAGFGENSEGDNTRDKWGKYLKGAYDVKTSVKTTDKGMKLALKTVLNFSGQGIPKVQAYDEILKARYIDKNLSNDDYLWAINKIKNPYPRHITESIKAVLSDTESKIQGWWGTSKEKSQTMNVYSGFMNWLDGELEKDKIPTVENMNEHLAVLRKDVPLYEPKQSEKPEIGEIIPKGGKKWKVTGYDVDGEPLVEEDK